VVALVVRAYLRLEREVDRCEGSRGGEDQDQTEANYDALVHPQSCLRAGVVHLPLLYCFHDVLSLER